MRKQITSVLAALIITGTLPTSAMAEPASTAVVQNDELPVIMDSSMYNVSKTGSAYTVTFNEDALWKSISIRYCPGKSVYYRAKGKKKWIQAGELGVDVKNKDVLEVCYGTPTAKGECIIVKIKERAMCKDNIDTTAVTSAFTYKMDDLAGYTVYYTLNGKKPTTKSTRLTDKGVRISKSCTLRVLITKPGYLNQYLYYKINISSSNKYAEKAGLVNKAGTYDEFGTGLNRYDITGHLYYTTDGTKPTTASKEIVRMVGSYGDLIKKTTTVNFLYIDEKGDKHYFKQIYVINNSVGNAKNADIVPGLGGGF